MKALKLSFLSLLLVFSTSVSSQNSPFRFGVNAGVNISKALIGLSDTHGTSFRVGYQFGVTVDYALFQKFSILSGISYITKGSKVEDLNHSGYVGGTPDFTHRFEQQYLQLPLCGAYKLTLSDDLCLMLGAGPYFAYGIGGRTTETLNGSVWSNGTSEREYKTFVQNRYGDVLKRFDAGLSSLANLEYQKFNLSIVNDLGLLDIAKSSSYQYRNFSLTLSVGYKF